ncbi:UNVERIFIED_CONTAM: Pentatricopeptide repeat-containing protein [Sesamum angustifolium]|uniref:Pentatricopeptide repeat-containing protein n=1 Tax=Sesamum angustifolium TaxID=2727405 RepID=A0AAW2NZR6_9LAMI
MGLLCGHQWRFFDQCPKSPTILSAISPKPLVLHPPPLSGDALVSAAVSILKHQRSKSRWSNLRSLLTATKDKRLTASQFSEIAVQLRNNAHLAMRFFQFTVDHSLSSHSLYSYATVIHILARSRLKLHALNLIKSAMCRFPEAQQQVPATPVAILEALIITYRACASAPFVFDLLVRACLESKKIDIAVEIYAILKSKNVYLRTRTCNSLIESVTKSRAYCDDRRMKDAMSLWEEMESRGLNHDAVAYNTVIGGFCGVGEVGRAEEIYREMVMKGVESTCITFEHLINGYCKTGDFDSVTMLYKDMCRKNFCPGSSTVNVIIKSLCDKNKISAASEFHRMAVKKHDVVLEKENYENLMRGLCQEGKTEEALKLQVEMVGKGFRPNSVGMEPN